MNIYEIRWHTGERSWVCANTIIEALQVYCTGKGVDFTEFDVMDDIVILSKLKWRFYQKNDSQSFAKYMRGRLVPGIIAETFINNVVTVSNTRIAGIKRLKFLNNSAFGTIG